MDVYDPQTLGIVVFGGFMVFSAIGITLVSTFSMKETSYEEALAKQRQDSGKIQPQRSDKKKKASEKKNKTKKKEEKPNGNLPEPEPEPILEPVVENSEPKTVPQVEPEPQPEPVPVPEPEPEVKPKPVVPEPAPKIVECPVPPTVSAVVPPLAPSPKEKKKKKVAKVELAPIKPVEVPEVVVKVEPVVAEVAVKASVAPAVAVPPKAEEPKTEAPTKKKSKKKAEPVATVETVNVPQPSPYKNLVSSLNSASFSESETQKLFEIISKKAGKDSWQLASQKGDPLAALKKQLEEKEKQLTAEQGNIAAAKTRVKELTKELSSAKSKMTSVETRMSSELSASGQEIAALQACMQASYQEHVKETQQLNSKIQSLQEQLENGPNAQLARLQQENSILRDALNQATSQAESRQNAELAKLRQDCVRLNRELKERTAAQHAEEERRKTLETKMAAAEEQLAQTKASHVEAEQALQKKLDRISEELCEVQHGSTIFQAQVDAAKEQAKTLTELQERMRATETELKDRYEELEILRAQLSQTTTVTEEKPSVETEATAQAEIQKEVEQLRSSLKEREGQLTSLEAEFNQLREELVTVKRTQAEETQNRVNVADTEWREYTAEIDQLKTSLKEKEDLVASLQAQLEKMESVDRAEAEPPFENLEKDARMISLEEELQQLKEEMERMKAKSNELREKNYAAVEALAAAERLSEERLSQAKAAQSETEQQLSSFQTDTRSAFQKLFPHISIDTHQSNWLEAFTHEAQMTLTHSQQSPAEQQHTVSSSDSTDLQKKLALSEESQRSLNAECEQYRSTLSETESMLKVLQESVEDGELECKSKILDAEQQKQAALDQVKVLKETIEKMNVERQDTDQLKGQVMLLEAQLEKQLESITISQTYAEEMSQLKALLSETQVQLVSANSEAQQQRAELSLVRQELQEVTRQVQNDESVQSAQVKTQLEEATNKLQTEEDIRQQVASNYEQAQKCVRDLEAQLEELKAAGEGPTEELKERLEKEKKLTRDLGQVATKLQQLLKSTQEELDQEKETMKNLQEQLHGKEAEESKEGTSV
ncbi:ribosome-binding protein 1-like isoform X1 [Sinocyclocheilus rhinocerous]|uniref:ribosome-binding protein 1-like isoform X1 n=1 Tax=Sinocyclocheilus rhinocerous TaxID=307959 RepID=UPI0007B90BF7|nr:PREDICTED: ribosome-binding protein 1-like isoform X1 [Sinocyclocheilus rhinocerous]XP_016409763.1 PREDICTED: ribosome-binding protein 1-like isoform X1 [Sinocyclocheilus rhinocerous]